MTANDAGQIPSEWSDGKIVDEIDRAITRAIQATTPTQKLEQFSAARELLRIMCERLKRAPA